MQIDSRIWTNLSEKYANSCEIWTNLSKSMHTEVKRNKKKNLVLSIWMIDAKKKNCSTKHIGLGH